ncbi:hypothetical protein Tco_0861237 [Tanacetum coccineum]|uniref:Uncharacterized protein n=1 Tax=Tanacetum coccineum TaxID=301880 RepID=A0ABQ5BHB8_9ASTR
MPGSSCASFPREPGRVSTLYSECGVCCGVGLGYGEGLGCCDRTVGGEEVFAIPCERLVFFVCWDFVLVLFGHIWNYVCGCWARCDGEFHPPTPTSTFLVSSCVDWCLAEGSLGWVDIGVRGVQYALVGLVGCVWGDSLGGHGGWMGRGGRGKREDGGKTRGLRGGVGIKEGAGGGWRGRAGRAKARRVGARLGMGGGKAVKGKGEGEVGVFWRVNSDIGGGAVWWGEGGCWWGGVSGGVKATVRLRPFLSFSRSLSSGLMSFLFFSSALLSSEGTHLSFSSSSLLLLSLLVSPLCKAHCAYGKYFEAMVNGPDQRELQLFSLRAEENFQILRFKENGELASPRFENVVFDLCRQCILLEFSLGPVSLCASNSMADDCLSIYKLVRGNCAHPLGLFLYALVRIGPHVGDFKLLLTFPTFLISPLFDSNDDFTSSDDESLSDEDVPMENFKIYSNPLFDDEEIISPKIDPHYFNADLQVKSLIFDPILQGIEKADFDLEEEIRLVENLLYDNSSPRSSEELNLEIADTIIESPSPSPIPVMDSDSLMEEIDLFLATNDSTALGLEMTSMDSKRDISFFEELLNN